MKGPDRLTIVRCPRCGSMDAASAGPVGIEFDRMVCASCGHSEICDEWQIKLDWNETLRRGQARLEHGWVLPSVRFGELWQSLRAREHGHDVFRRLRAGYDEPHRAYHTAAHVGDCLRLLDEPAVVALATDPVEVEAALWFHDVVYDPRARDNEQRSAELSTQLLSAAGVDRLRVARIAEHILATRSHVATAPDARLVVDIDLAILAADERRFADFESAIRAEYAWVEPAAFRAGRLAVLRGFSERASIYATDLLRQRWEARARQNLQLACVRLTADEGAR